MDKVSDYKLIVRWREKEITFRTPPLETVERIEKILMWAHKRKFPNVTPDEQLAKCMEEKDELLEAFDAWYDDEENTLLEREYYREIADVMFALEGLKRFDDVLATDELYELGFNYGIDVEVGVPLMITKLLEVYFERTYVNNRHVN